MDEPVTARYRFDADEMAEALAAHQRHATRPWVRLLLYAAVLFYLVATIGFPLVLAVSPLSSPEVRRNSAVALIVIGAAWVWLVTGVRGKRFLRWKARRVFRSMPSAVEITDWSFGPDQIISRTSLSAATLLWPRYVKVVETPRGFMLYQSIQLFNWIPGHAFASEGELRRFAELARGRVPAYVVVGECRHEGKPGSIDPDGF